MQVQRFKVPIENGYQTAIAVNEQRLRLLFVDYDQDSYSLYLRSEDEIFKIKRSGHNVNFISGNGKEIKLTPDVLHSQHIKIGEPFCYQIGGQTKPITEIIVVNLTKVYPTFPYEESVLIKEFEKIKSASV
jgi:hypothetical protein